MFSFKAIVVSIAALVVGVQAERHTVHFDNRCGFGTPTLIQGGRVLSTGGDYTHNGPLEATIAYLQTGGCGFNGEGCTLVELTLKNGWSSADISLISPLRYSVTSGFGYYNGCDGAGTNCDHVNCPAAFRQPWDNWVQVGCPANDVNLAITFC